MKVPIICAALAAMLLACEQREPVAEGANDTSGLPATNETAPDISGAPPANAETPVTDAPAPAAKSIPAALHGRWGMTPMDCTSTRGDNKGLLTVSAEDLRFYESRAVPTEDAQTSANSISGNFRFTGEGQTWTKYQALQLQKDGLVRSETNPAASFTYAKCK